MNPSCGRKTIAPGAASLSNMTADKVATHPAKTPAIAKSQVLVVMDMFKRQRAGAHVPQGLSQITHLQQDQVAEIAISLPRKAIERIVLAYPRCRCGEQDVVISGDLGKIHAVLRHLLQDLRQGPVAGCFNLDPVAQRADHRYPLIGGKRLGRRIPHHHAQRQLIRADIGDRLFDYPGIDRLNPVFEAQRQKPFGIAQTAGGPIGQLLRIHREIPLIPRHLL